MTRSLGPWKIRLSVAVSDVIQEDNQEYMCVLYLSSNGQWIPVAKTEKIEGSKPLEFTTDFAIYYRFEDLTPIRLVLFKGDSDKKKENEIRPPPELYEQQRIAFQPRPLEVPHEDYYFAEVSCCLPEVLITKNNLPNFPLLNGSTEKGNMRIVAKDISDDRLTLSMQFRAKNLPSSQTFTKQASIIKISSTTPQFSSEKEIVSSNSVDNTNPIWGLMESTLSELCDGDIQSKCLRITVEVGGKNIGHFNTSVDSLLKTRMFTLTNNGKKVSDCKIYLIHYNLHLRNSFLDYLTNGWEIHMMAAIDFTASNGVPTNPTSLHYISESENDYEYAIRNIGSVLEHYNPYKTFPALGYGALLSATTATVSHCFPLNNNSESPDVYGYQGILDEYHKCLETLILKGPAIFSQLIREGMRYADNSISNDECTKYTHLFILTDGVVFDWRDTIDAIVAASKLPLSITIVGVGNSDFDKMDSLQGTLESSIGTSSVRDNIKFVKLSRDMSESAFRRECLQIIPSQMVQYLHMSDTRVHVEIEDEILRHSNTLDTFANSCNPSWVPDAAASNCNCCNCPFTFLVRKHHCRACGNIVCGNCSPNSIAIPQLNMDSPQRCCDDCYALLLRS